MPNNLFPAKGSPADEVLARLRAMRAEDADWKSGRTFSLVYHAGEEISALLKQSYTEYMSENGLSPIAFPSLRRMESEVLAMTGALLSGGETVCGSMTSGGTESILMAMKTAREWGRKEKGLARPEIIAPATAHPAFDKAAHYLDVTLHHAPITKDFRVDVAEVAKLVNSNTVMVVGSAPSYPQGVVDPITELAALAKERGLLCHVDACLGGFLLPFARKLGRPIPPFDFTVPGVTSISADLHKYGFAAKGASVVLYRDEALRRHQFFTYAGWSGGLYASPSMCGTRPGGAIAAAWTVLNYLGEEGYLGKVRGMFETADRLRSGINSIPGLRVLGEPVGTVFAFTSDSLDVFALGDSLEARGWKLDRQGRPPALHVMLTPAHAQIVEPLLSDLRECAASLASGVPAPEGSAAMYGMVGAMPDQDVETFLVDFLDGLYRV